MNKNIERFSRKTLESLTDEERDSVLRELEFTLSERLENYKDGRNEYWQETKTIIEELKLLEHDLWSWDYDGERRELWGWDYMQTKNTGSLQIRFDILGLVRTYWKNTNPQLDEFEE